MKIPPSSVPGLVVISHLALAPSAMSAVAVEYFNDYGTTSPTGLVSGALNGGSGWSGVPIHPPPSLIPTEIHKGYP